MKTNTKHILIPSAQYSSSQPSQHIHSVFLSRSHSQPAFHQQSLFHKALTYNPTSILHLLFSLKPTQLAITSSHTHTLSISLPSVFTTIYYHCVNHTSTGVGTTIYYQEDTTVKTFIYRTFQLSKPLFNLLLLHLKLLSLLCGSFWSKMFYIEHALRYPNHRLQTCGSSDVIL